MDKLEDELEDTERTILNELLPGIEKFLRTTLAKESLSKLAEKQRQYYVERLDIIQLPPHLPPKPEGGERLQMQGRKLPEPVNSKSDDDFIAQQRAISRQAVSTSNTSPRIITGHTPVPNNGLGIDSDQYDDGLYEEPVPMGGNIADSHNYLASGSKVATFDIHSDGENSSTSYESYDEPEMDEPYNNVDCDGQVKTEIALPRLKTKRKKKSTSIHDRYHKQLEGVIHEGELYHRSKVSSASTWSKRFCALCDGMFYCYKDKDSKPMFSIALYGYDVTTQEKEKGRSNVLRLSHPGCETHFISTDSVNETQAWLNKFEACCNIQPSEPAGNGVNPKTSEQTGSVSSMETYAENSSLAMNDLPGGKNRKVTNTLSSDGKREKKGKIGKFLSETFGKKKGRTVAHHLEISEGSLLDRASLTSPDISISGIVKLSSPDMLHDSGWQYKHCAIRNGIFECFKDDSTSSDLEFSLLLTDYELSAPDKSSLSLAITRQGLTAFIMEPDNKLDQGDWLSAMLKHVGNGGVSDDAYTYVDHKGLAHPSLSIDTFSTGHSNTEAHSSGDDRQYADLSDKEEEDERQSGMGSGDGYDEPPVEGGDRLSKVYEEVSESSLLGAHQKFKRSANIAADPAESSKSGQLPQPENAVAETNRKPFEVLLSDWLNGPAERTLGGHTYEISKGGNATDTGDVCRFSNSSDYDVPQPSSCDGQTATSGMSAAFSLDHILAAYSEPLMCDHAAVVCDGAGSCSDLSYAMVSSECSVAGQQEPREHWTQPPGAAIRTGYKVISEQGDGLVKVDYSNETANSEYLDTVFADMCVTDADLSDELGGEEQSLYSEPKLRVKSSDSGICQADIAASRHGWLYASCLAICPIERMFDEVSDQITQELTQSQSSVDQLSTQQVSSELHEVQLSDGEGRQSVQDAGGVYTDTAEASDSDFGYEDMMNICDGGNDDIKCRVDVSTVSANSLQEAALTSESKTADETKNSSEKINVRQLTHLYEAAKLSDAGSLVSHALPTEGKNLKPVDRQFAGTALTFNKRRSMFEVPNVEPIREGLTSQSRSIRTENIKKSVTDPSITPTVKIEAEVERMTREDVKTKANIAASPTPSTESNRPSFSRESSCSSEGSSRKISESIAKNRAMFENSSSNGGSSTGGKWTGFKLAGAPSAAVKRTSSISSTASTKSTPNSATSSPKISRAHAAAISSVDRCKAAFEGNESNNNTIINTQSTPSPGTPRKTQADSGKSASNSGKTSGIISPIRISADKEDEAKPPPKFTSIFTTQTTVQVNSNKPRKLEIKSVTPSPYPGSAAAGGRREEKNALNLDTSLRFNIDLTSKDKSVTLAGANRAPAKCSEQKSTTLPASSSRTAFTNASLSATTSPRIADHRSSALSSPSTNRASAKSFLTSTLQRFSTGDSNYRGATSNGAAAADSRYGGMSEEEEQRRLDELRQKLISLRKERQKVRDQKLSTVLPEHLDKLNAEYKRIDGDYKTTHREIETLEEQKLQRIKDLGQDSIERRRTDAEKNAVIGKKKLWEASS